METRILEGKAIASGIRQGVARRVAALNRSVSLAIVLAGDDPASRLYSESIGRAAAKVGINAELIELTAGTGAEGVGRTLRDLGDDPSVSGILVQRPLPAGMPGSVIEEIAPSKDVDCATSRSLGLLMTGGGLFAPCTALGVLEILSGHGISVSGAEIVIVGRSTVVGKPLACLLMAKSPQGNATVTVCHTGTRDLAAHTRRADIVVAAMGSPEALRADMISEGAVVVDVGINSVDDPASDRGRRLVGDVAFEEMLGRASAVTPVPGGVGTLTTSILLRSAVVAAESSANAD
ncbi:MAG: bifunctional 5,10-methylenetetrahydrofolate dehydrogenase/5,10-methenyltetrahydrofolate cyclohydrolase [Candidatus Eisenbacteria bacterium]|nr:bifunctional 5,10-methylenetetrahydrofolate dehydrogenase/5,10-methenyltetrahydrofolate cyclohydrolase [Candidatus Eisenbacteria bacterium]